jgi:hypothetical protein
MKFRFLIILTCFLMLLSACGKKTIGGNGKVVSQQRNLTGFKAISIKGAYDVYLKKGNTESVTIEADSNLLSIIKTDLSDSLLDIYNLKTIIRSKELRLIITCPNLTSIDFSGATELSCDSGLVFKDLSINISGAGRIDMNLKLDNLTAIVSGGADLNFIGKANSLDVSITGAGNLDARGFETQKCKIDISGFGRAKVNVLQKLDVNISGAGKVDYYGNPVVQQSVTGAGKIHKIGQ